MGVDFARRWQHLRESVEALRVLWSATTSAMRVSSLSSRGEAWSQTGAEARAADIARRARS